MKKNTEFLFRCKSYKKNINGLYYAEFPDVELTLTQLTLTQVIVGSKSNIISSPKFLIRLMGLSEMCKHSK